MAFRCGTEVLGIALEHSGDANYRNRVWTLAYGIKSGALQTGVGFCIPAYQAAGYPGISFGSAGVGICFHVSDKLTAGWELGLPVFGIAGKTNPEKAPQIFRMGFGYEYRTGFIYIHPG